MSQERDTLKCLELSCMGLKKCPSANVRRPCPPGGPSESVYLKEPVHNSSGRTQGTGLADTGGHRGLSANLGRAQNASFARVSPQHASRRTSWTIPGPSQAPVAPPAHSVNCTLSIDSFKSSKFTQATIGAVFSSHLRFDLRYHNSGWDVRSP